MAVEGALIAARWNFLGVVNITTASEPAEFTFAHAVAPQFADRDSKLPRAAPSVRCVVISFQQPTNRALGRLQQKPFGVGNLAVSTKCYLRRLIRKHPAALPSPT